MNYLIKYDGKVNEGSIETLWGLDIVQSALTWGDPWDIDAFKDLLDSGRVLELGNGKVRVWRRDYKAIQARLKKR